MRTPLPHSVGPYTILRELGRGGMGVVYLARDPRLQRDVALKQLPTELYSDSEARERFLGEARTLATLNHPNIATIYSLEETGERHFLTMELVEGQSLWEHLHNQSRLAIDETLSVIRQVVRGVEAAHAKGVVHRDLKPSNVMLRADGTVKVLDFGLAFRLKAEWINPVGMAPGAGEVSGTPGYMSPEQVRGEPVDPRTDVWAVGCMLYECLFGNPLIQGQSVADKLTATVSFDQGHMPERVGLETLSDRLSHLLRRCVAASADDRFFSMREVRLLIEEEVADRALPRAPDGRATIRDSGTVLGNLPVRLTSFVGRKHDLEEMARLLTERRLVSITGAGGCGKTRLAQELASQMAAAYPDGAWLVELASIADPALVPASAAAVLGVRLAPGTSTLDALLQFVGAKEMLLILDNCEHLVDACADLAGRLLRACPHARILATSREALRVEGEAVYALSPLAMPRGASGVAMEDSDAVRLFVDRARAVLPTFHLDETSRAAVHEICRRLDGIPLAIELAAARVKTLPVDKIRELLDDRFRLLTRGSRSAQPHQSTLRALIDWSYDRLDSKEQALFRRLSVFRGAWVLDAVESVAAGGDVEPWEALDLFTRLVEKSLIVREMAAHGAGSARFYMLETVRAYASEKLRAVGEEERSALRQYRDYIVRLSIEGEQGLRGRDQAAWGARLADALADVRAVLELTSLEPDGAEAGLLVAGSYWLQWMNRGMLKEGSDAIARALAHPAADRNSAPYGRALVGAGNLAYQMGQVDHARELYQSALSVLSLVGTHQQVGGVYLNLGNIAFLRGENDEAQRLYETALDFYRRANSTLWIAGCLTNLSMIALAREDIGGIEALQTEALRIYEEAGISDQICLCMFQLGIAALVRGNYDLARARYDRALLLAREIDHGMNMMAALTNIATLELIRGRPEEARGMLVECVSRLKDMRAPAVALPTFEALAWLAADKRPAEAATLLAAASALRASLKMPLLPYERATIESLNARLARDLGVEELARFRNAGGGMSVDTAITAAEALLDATR